MISGFLFSPDEDASFDDVDTNGDRKIDIDEFLTWMGVYDDDEEEEEAEVEEELVETEEVITSEEEEIIEEEEEVEDESFITSLISEVLEE